MLTKCKHDLFNLHNACFDILICSVLIRMFKQKNLFIITSSLIKMKSNILQL